MRVRRSLAAVAISTIALPLRAHADPANQTMKYAVMRGDMQIGTDTIDVRQKGVETRVQMDTHISVGMAFITFYKFDQTENEIWANGRLMTMNAVTDDNGTVHRTSASSRNGKIVVEADGQMKDLPSTILPESLWNPALLAQNAALDPQDGSVEPLSVTDLGEDNLVIGGHAQRAHHYVIKTKYARDVWYDTDNRLVKVELKGSDGSTIRYQRI